MIISLSNERVAQLQVLGAFIKKTAMVAIAAVALYLALVSVLGYEAGKLARTHFEAWGGRKRLGQVVKAAIVEAVGFVAWAVIVTIRGYKAAAIAAPRIMDWVAAAIAVWPVTILDTLFCLEPEAA